MIIIIYSFYAYEGLLHTRIRLYDMCIAIILIFNNLQIEIDIQLGSLIIDRFTQLNVMFSLYRTDDPIRSSEYFTAADNNN